MRRNLTNRATLGGTCSMLRELMKVDEKGAFVSGQYAELIELLNIADKWYEGSVQRYVGLFAKAASALTTLTQKLERWEKLWKDTGFEHGDTSVPIANGGASTEASGKAIREALQELVTLKDMKNQIIELAAPNTPDSPFLAALNETYKRRQPLAWEAARKALVAEVDGTAPETSTRSAEE